MSLDVALLVAFSDKSYLFVILFEASCQKPEFSVFVLNIDCYESHCAANWQNGHYVSISL